MSFSNELTISQMSEDGADESLLSQLREADAEIDRILRSGGTSQDVRETQRRFNGLLSTSHHRSGSTHATSS
ncbi:hypothetical protein ACX80O_04430 [Arthrobacter sp. Hz1]